MHLQLDVSINHISMNDWIVTWAYGFETRNIVWYIQSHRLAHQQLLLPLLMHALTEKNAASEGHSYLVNVYPCGRPSILGNGCQILT